MRICAAILIAFLLADSADACNRCGLFGNRCRFSHHAKVVSQVVPQASQTINIATVYPAGTTQYGSVQAISQLYATNPELAITAASRAADGATQALTAAITASMLGNQHVAEIAKIQAATQHLQAAVGTSSSQQSLTLRITQSGGGIKVEQVEAPKPDPDAPRTPAILQAKCGSCHGPDLAEPKGGVSLGGAQMSPERAMRAIDLLYGREVPDAMAGVIGGITAEERDQLIEEITSLVKGTP